MTQAHPLRCWTEPGHERCALRAAANLTEQRAAHHTGRARLFRAALGDLAAGVPVADIQPGILDAARRVMGEPMPTSVVRWPA